MFKLTLTDEDEDHEAYRSGFEEQYWAAWARARTLLDSRHQPQSSAFYDSNVLFNNKNVETSNRNLLLSPTKVDGPSISNPVASQHYFSSGLPIITLPKFRGTIDSWLEFRDAFKSLVHDEPNLDPIRKLFYLKGCLSGEAADVISFIESSAQNYEVAWSLLHDRYDNRKLMRDTYIKNLIKMPFVAKQFSTRMFVDCIQKNLRAFQATGEPIQHWDSFLIVLLRDKLNDHLRDRWDEHVNDVPNPTILQFVSFLNRKAQLESTKSRNVQLQSANLIGRPASPISKLNSRPQRVYTATTFSPHCSLCGGDHFTSSCSKLLNLSVSQRWEAARKGEWCTNCLR